MKRTAGMCLLLTVLSGCVATESGYMGGMGGMGGMSGSCCPGPNGDRTISTVPGVQGPYGEPVAKVGPYATPMTAAGAHAMMASSIPLNMMQTAGMNGPASPSGVMQAGAMMPAGLPSGIMPAGGPMLPPPGSIAPPGMPTMPPMNPMMRPPGAVAAVGALTGGASQHRFPAHRTSARFIGPAGMKIAWYAPTGDGKTGFVSTQIEAPGRYNFIQAAVYRLKLTDIANRPGLELYPTLEVVPTNAKTEPFLAHCAVPITFTDEDFDQVVAGNYVVKVIYLPDPQFQDLATSGPDEVVSSRLEPGVDPIAEAHRRGNILLVIRMGNIDLEAPNTPPMDAPTPYQAKPAMPPAPGGQGMAPMMPGQMPPMGAAGQGQPMMPQMPPMGAAGQGQPMMPPGMMPPGAAGQGQPMMPPGMMPPAQPAAPPGQPQTAAPTQDAGNVAQLPNSPMIQLVQHKPVEAEAPSPAALASQDEGQPKAPVEQPKTPVKKTKKSHRWWR